MFVFQIKYAKPPVAKPVTIRKTLFEGDEFTIKTSTADLNCRIKDIIMAAKPGQQSKVILEFESPPEKGFPGRFVVTLPEKKSMTIGESTITVKSLTAVKKESRVIGRKAVLEISAPKESP
jgi:hypothetical protein